MDKLIMEIYNYGIGYEDYIGMISIPLIVDLFVKHNI